MNRFPHGLLILICILAAVLRLYALDRMALWGDEACMVYLCAESPGDIVKALASEDRPDVDVAPPLYFLLLHAWMKLIGNSVTAFRGFSALFGVLTVLLTAQLGSILFDQKTGLLAAFLTAIHPFQIWYSQEGRMYSLAAFLATATLASIAYTLKKPERLIGWVMLALSGISLLYTQYYGALLLAAIVVFALFEFRKTGRYHASVSNRYRLGGVLAFWTLAFLPWLPVLFTDYRHAGASGGFPLNFHWFMTPAFLLTKFAVFGLENYIRNNFWLYPIPLLIVFLLIIKALKQWVLPEVRLLTLSILLPFGLVYILSLVGMRVYKSHPFIIFHSAFLVLVAYGFQRLSSCLRLIMGILLIAALCSVNMTLVLAGNYQKPRVHDVVDWILEQNGETVAVVPAFIPNPMPIVGDLLAFKYYNDDRLNVDYLVGDTAQDMVNAIVEHADGQDTVYVVFQQNVHVLPFVDEILKNLDGIWALKQRKEFVSLNRDFSMAVVKYETHRL